MGERVSGDLQQILVRRARAVEFRWETPECRRGQHVSVRKEYLQTLGKPDAFLAREQVGFPVGLGVDECRGQESRCDVVVVRRVGEHRRELGVVVGALTACDVGLLGEPSEFTHRRERKGTLYLAEVGADAFDSEVGVVGDSVERRVDGVRDLRVRRLEELVKQSDRQTVVCVECVGETVHGGVAGRRVTVVAAGDGLQYLDDGSHVLPEWTNRVHRKREVLQTIPRDDAVRLAFLEFFTAQRPMS